MKLEIKANRTMKITSTMGALGAIVTLCGSALAQGGEASGGISLGSGGVSTSGDAQASEPAAPATGGETPYMKRYLPEPNLWEFGFFGGLMFPASKHELVQDGSGFTQHPFKVAGEVGLRVAYFPLSFLGVEIEGAGMPSKVDSGGGGSAGGLFAARGHLVGQLPIASVTPFAVLGMGALGGASTAMGTDVDPAIHFGVGAKAAIDEYLSARLDIRDTMTQKFGASAGSQVHHPEVLLGLTFTIERKTPDSDGDGFADHRDKCPNQVGTEQGCPPAKEATPEGCPEPSPTPAPAAQGPMDSDGDGRTDDVDKCPKEAASTDDGCPVVVRDADGDGIEDAKDKCPKEKETENGFQDEDGCPDELPAEVKKFSGVIKGIEFDYNSATIRAASKPLLDQAAKVLKQYPDLKVEISGHTDTDGSKERNTELSKLRAEAVKKYLVAAGVDAGHLETRGAGPNEPIASNDTVAGKAQNRRIEFKVHK